MTTSMLDVAVLVFLAGVAQALTRLGTAATIVPDRISRSIFSCSSRRLSSLTVRVGVGVSQPVVASPVDA